MNLALAAAVDINPADPRHALDALLDHIGDEVAELVHRAAAAVQFVDDKPRDGVVFAAGRVQSRLVDFVRVAGHAVQTVGDQQQRAVHVAADAEFQRDAPAPLLGLAGNRAQALEAGQLFFLAVDDFALDFDRGRAEPFGGDGDDRAVDIRRQLNRDGAQRHQAEQHHQQHRGDDCDGAVDGGGDEVHWVDSVGGDSSVAAAAAVADAGSVDDAGVAAPVAVADSATVAAPVAVAAVGLETATG